MLVRVGDAAINKARTPEQVLRHIDQVIPFIELPDLVVQVPPRGDQRRRAAGRDGDSDSCAADGRLRRRAARHGGRRRG
jgi:hypothetical protein